VSEPFIFVATHAIKEGKLPGYEGFFRKFCLDVVEANEPRLIAFNGYASEDGGETSVIQVHPDADSMLFHMNLIRGHVDDIYDEFLEGTTRVEIFGKPSDATLDMIRQLSGSGVQVTVKPLGLGGFTRSAAERTLAGSG
jgi:hypothetical protein